MKNNLKPNFEIANLQIIDDGILNSLGLKTEHNFSESNFSESNFVSNVKLDLSSSPTNANIDLSFEGNDGKAVANSNVGRYISVNGIYKKQGFFKEGTIKHVVKATTLVFQNEKGLHKSKAIVFADGTASNPAKWDKIGSSNIEGEEHSGFSIGGWFKKNFGGHDISKIKPKQVHETIVSHYIVNAHKKNNDKISTNLIKAIHDAQKKDALIAKNVSMCATAPKTIFTNTQAIALVTSIYYYINSFKRKIKIDGSSYYLLIKNGFSPEQAHAVMMTLKSSVNGFDSNILANYNFTIQQEKAILNTIQYLNGMSEMRFMSITFDPNKFALNLQRGGDFTRGSSNIDGEEHANMVSNVKLDLSTANNAVIDLDFEGDKEKCSCGNSNCSGCDGTKGCGCGSSNCSGSNIDGEEHANMVSNVKLDLSTANNATVDLDFDGEEHSGFSIGGWFKKNFGGTDISKIKQVHETIVSHSIVNAQKRTIRLTKDAPLWIKNSDGIFFKSLKVVNKGETYMVNPKYKPMHYTDKNGNTKSSLAYTLIIDGKQFYLGTGATEVVKV